MTSHVMKKDVSVWQNIPISQNELIVQCLEYALENQDGNLEKHKKTP